MPTLGRLCMEIASPMASSQRYEANWSAKTHGWRYFDLAPSSITIWGGLSAMSKPGWSLGIARLWKKQRKN